jgi:hypothetical protein
VLHYRLYLNVTLKRRKRVFGISGVGQKKITLIFYSYCKGSALQNSYPYMWLFLVKRSHGILCIFLRFSPGVRLSLEYTLHQPLKMDPTEGSETSVKLNLTPGENPPQNTQDSEHGETLKSRAMECSTAHTFLPSRVCRFLISINFRNLVMTL